MINTAELATLQAERERSFSATATVFRKTQVADSSGGFLDSFVSVGSYPCSFARAIVNPVERERDVRIQAISYWMFSFPTGADVRLTDRLRVGTRTFEVTGGGEVSLPMSLRITAQEIT